MNLIVYIGTQELHDYPSFTTREDGLNDMIICIRMWKIPTAVPVHEPLWGFTTLDIFPLSSFNLLPSGRPRGGYSYWFFRLYCSVKARSFLNFSTLSGFILPAFIALRFAFNQFKSRRTNYLLIPSISPSTIFISFGIRCSIARHLTLPYLSKSMSSRSLLANSSGISPA